MRFGTLHFITDDVAWHPASAALPEGVALAAGSMHFVANCSGVMCFQILVPPQPAEPRPRQPLGSSPSTRAAKAAPQLIGVVDSDSILPVLYSESGGYESFYSSTSIMEVFMIGNTGDDTEVPSAAAKAAEDALLCMPVAGDLEMHKAIEASCVAILAKR